MIKPWDDFRGSIVDLLESHGLNVIYVTTAIALFVCIMAARRIRKWDQLEESEQSLIKSVFIATAGMIIICILELAGVFDPWK